MGPPSQSVPMLTTWDDWIDALTAYRGEHGHGNVPGDYIAPTGHRLGRWLAERRKAYRTGKLPAEQIDTLRALGVTFAGAPGGRSKPAQPRRAGAADAVPVPPRTLDWDEGLAELAAFRDAHGDREIPRNYITPTGGELGEWLRLNRIAYRKGGLTEEQIAAMTRLLINLHNLRPTWERWLALLTAYHDQHGHTDIVNSYTTPEGHRLGVWLAQVRRQYRAGALPAEQEQALRALGYDVARVGRSAARPRPQQPRWKPSTW